MDRESSHATLRGRVRIPVRSTAVPGRLLLARIAFISFPIHRWLTATRSASFPDAAIPAGVPPQSLHAFASTNIDKRIELQGRSSIYVVIMGDGLTAGMSELKLTFVPFEAPESGQYAHVCPVHVRPASWRPLRASSGADHLLQGLDEKSVLFGIAFCPANIPDAPSIAASLIEKWGRASPDDGEYLINTSSNDSEAKSKDSSVKAQGFFQSPRWKKLKAELASAAVVKAERRDPNAVHKFMFRNLRGDAKPVHPRQSLRGYGGFTFGRSLHALYSHPSLWDRPRGSGVPYPRALAEY